jgi:hypothetical protein
MLGVMGKIARGCCNVSEGEPLKETRKKKKNATRDLWNGRDDCTYELDLLMLVLWRAEPSGVQISPHYADNMPLIPVFAG